MVFFRVKPAFAATTQQKANDVVPNQRSESFLYRVFNLPRPFAQKVSFIL